MSKEIPRRDALRHLAVFGAASFFGSGLLACSKKTTCLDVSGLTSDEVTQRNVTAAYVDESPDMSKYCDGCVQFVPGQGCGSCKVVKGPINPKGYCKLFVAKPA